MTTIAYRDGVLAADTQVNFGDAKYGRTTKVVSVKGVLVAGAGNLACAQAFCDWVRKGMAGDGPRMADESVGILIPPDGIPLEFREDGWCRVEAPMFVWGSGEQIAMGAMLAGADAETAVRIACEYDLRSGGEVTVLRHAE